MPERSVTRYCFLRAKMIPIPGTRYHDERLQNKAALGGGFRFEEGTHDTSTRTWVEN